MKEYGSERPWPFRVVSSKRNREAPFPENKLMMREMAEIAELNAEVIHDGTKLVFLKSSTTEAVFRQYNIEQEF